MEFGLVAAEVEISTENKKNKTKLNISIGLNISKQTITKLIDFERVKKVRRRKFFGWQKNKNLFFSELFQGIKFPVERKSTNFDALAISSVAQTHAPAMKHFFAYIMQFQILKALCPHATNLVEFGIELSAIEM